MSFEQIKSFIWIGSLILAGAIANTMQLFLVNRKSQLPSRLGEMIANFLLAAFGGLISGLIAKLAINDMMWVSVISGIGGYAGVDGLNKIKDIVLDTLINIIKRKND